jgi:hypothetical protein
MNEWNEYRLLVIESINEVKNDIKGIESQLYRLNNALGEIRGEMSELRKHLAGNGNKRVQDMSITAGMVTAIVGLVEVIKYLIFHI